MAAELGPDYYELITGEEGNEKMLNALYRLNEIKEYLSYDESEETSSANFLDGQYTFQLDGSWFAGRIELEDIEVYPFPAIDEEIGTPLLSGFTSGFYITKKAWDNPEKRAAAVNFINGMTSTESLSNFVTVGGFASDPEAKPTAEDDIQVALRLLASFIDYNVLPLGDSSKAGTYANLVEGQAAFVTKDETVAEAAVSDYLAGQ